MLCLHQRKLITLTAVILLFAVLSPVTGYYTYAAKVPALDQIRVALFIQSRDQSPAVTLSASEPLAIGIRQADGVKEWLTHPQNQAVRFSPNGFALRVLETADHQAAVNTYASIATSGYAELFEVSLKGKTMYEVRLSGFRTEAEAVAAKTRVPGSLQQHAEVKGSLFASAGTFQSLQEAENLQGSLAQNGIQASISIHPNEQQEIVYAVWIGEAVSNASLEQTIADAATKAPGIVFHPVNPDMPYLLKRKAASLQSSQAEGIVHYQYQEQNQKVWISAGDAAIKVAERYGRQYRGQMEVTTHGGKLALINQLPFEQYLYSVVSSELGAGWPLEALKAQAVAARTFALKQGMKYAIAHISDTTYDQAYKGKDIEFAAAIQAVDETRGEVLMDGAGLIEPFYSSNAGGLTADSSEVWTSAVSYVSSVKSPDEVAQEGKLPWYRIMLQDGKTGYIRSDYARLTNQKNDAGFAYIEVIGDNINIRKAPYVDNSENAAIAQASRGERYALLGQDVESNPFRWIRGPYTAEKVKSSINARSTSPITGELQTLAVTARGPSGRVISMEANGKPVTLRYPDEFRSALGGLLSTKFEVEETGKYTILGARGAKRQFPQSAGALSVASGKGTTTLQHNEFVVINADHDVRVATRDVQFRFIGQGFGHGLGMSQYGTKALAEQGYDYATILLHYYDNVSIVKE